MVCWRAVTLATSWLFGLITGLLDTLSALSASTSIYLSGSEEMHCTPTPGRPVWLKPGGHRHKLWWLLSLYIVASSLNNMCTCIEIIIIPL